MAKFPGDLPSALVRLLEEAQKAGAKVEVMNGNDLLAEAASEGGKPIPEARIAELEVVAGLYAVKECPFKVGDIVTPRRNSGLRGHGNPHIVVEVLTGDDLVRRWDGNPAGGDYGSTRSMRVLGIRDDVDGDKIIPWWCEHFQYELFDTAKDYEVKTGE